jgi:hypothetical protein
VRAYSYWRLPQRTLYPPSVSLAHDERVLIHARLFLLDRYEQRAI